MNATIFDEMVAFFSGKKILERLDNCRLMYW